MALLIWLPLINDFRNLGLDPSQFSGGTFSEGGKFGKCLNLSSTITLTLTSDLIKNITTSRKYSICTWFKHGQTSYGGWAFRLGNNGTVSLGSRGLWIGSAAQNQYQFAWYGSGITYGNMTTGLCDGDWHHLAFIVNDTLVLCYIDGISQTSTVLSTVPINILGTDKYLLFYNMALFNDFRVYDHCLSPKEVKEISKALVLHFPLDNIAHSPIMYDCSGYKNNGTMSGTGLIDYSKPRYSNCLSFNNTIILVPKISQILSISFWIHVPDTITNQVAYVDPGSGMSFGYYNNSIVTSCSTAKLKKSISLFTPGWHHVYQTTENKLYVDGIEAENSSGSDFWVGVANLNLIIGARNISFNSAFNNLLSDFRAYATILSENDIKELYQLSGRVLEDGTIECLLFIESSKTRLINKFGLSLAQEFNEWEGDYDFEYVVLDLVVNGNNFNRNITLNPTKTYCLTIYPREGFQIITSMWIISINNGSGGYVSPGSLTVGETFTKVFTNASTICIRCYHPNDAYNTYSGELVYNLTIGLIPPFDSDKLELYGNKIKSPQLIEI